MEIVVRNLYDSIFFDGRSSKMKVQSKNLLWPKVKDHYREQQRAHKIKSDNYDK